LLLVLIELLLLRLLLLLVRGWLDGSFPLDLVLGLLAELGLLLLHLLIYLLLWASIVLITAERELLFVLTAHLILRWGLRLRVSIEVLV
jgi:hypothetical protein